MSLAVASDSRGDRLIHRQEFARRKRVRRGQTRTGPVISNFTALVSGMFRD